MKRFLSASLPLVLASLAAAQTTSTSNETAGSVAGKSSSGTTYSGLSGSASAATVSYSTPGGNTPPEDKFTTGPSGPGTRTFGGVSNGGYTSQGGSAVSGGSPIYYTADTSNQQSAAGVPPTGRGGGTFDPFPIRSSDVSAFGSNADLYFQAGLRQRGALGSTGFSLVPGATGSYQFDAYITIGSVRQDILSFLVTPTGLASATYSAPADFRVYLLGSNADDANADPSRRLAAGTPIGPTAGLSAVIGPFINPDGSLKSDLQFGILRQGFAVPTSGSPSDTLFVWHADVLNRVAPVQAAPEPMTLAPLGLGALVLLRRRRGV